MNVIVVNLSLTKNSRTSRLGNTGARTEGHLRTYMNGPNIGLDLTANRAAEKSDALVRVEFSGIEAARNFLKELQERVDRYVEPDYEALRTAMKK
jgi:hypothetical protein